MKNNKIHLVFSTTAGDFEDDFPLNQPLHAVKTRVMAKLGLDVSQQDDFIVTFEGNPLDESKKLGELGLEDGAILFIERKEVVKI